jgi:hypothetical protein
MHDKFYDLNYALDIRISFCGLRVVMDVRIKFCIYIFSPVVLQFPKLACNFCRWS